MPSDGAAARDTSLLSIGEVLAQLRTEFPDTTISKLRFLETEGLVQPQRTPSGYRKYSPDDVARLRYVLAAQRDQYLPLRVIRQQLDDGLHIPAQPATPHPAARQPTPLHPAPLHPAPLHPAPLHPAPRRPTLVAVTDDFVDEQIARTPDTKVHREQLCARAGVDAELVADLERHGLLTPTGGGDWFDADSVTVAEVAGRLAAYGIQARHLRGYKVTADREAGLLAQIVAPLLRQQSGARDGGERELASRARADEAIRELILLSQRLHLALLRQGLNETLGH